MPVGETASVIRWLERESHLGFRKIYLDEGASALIPSAPPAQKTKLLEDLQRRATGCARCSLSQTRSQAVFGEGDLSAELVLVGEAPGEEEDRSGRPFVGQCGQLLDRMLKAIHIERENVYICNVLKCRPPGNRPPAPEEMRSCLPFLEQQIDLIGPKLVCALGRVAFDALVRGGGSLNQARGKVHRYGDIPLIVTFHPGYLLRSPAEKKLAWEDMKLMAKLLGRPVD